MSKLCYIFIFIAFALPSGNPLPSIMDIVGAIESATEYVNGWLGNSSEDKIIKVFQDKINEVNAKLDKIENEIQNIAEQLPEVIKQALRLNDLRKYTTSLNTLYQDYESYSNNITHFENVTLENFANKKLSYAVLNRTPYQVFFNVYNYIALTQMKGYIMTQFSYMLLKLHNKGNFTMEMLTMKNRYVRNTKEVIELLKKITKPLSRDIWKWDPTVHIKDETYVEITQLVQGHIQNEVDLNSIGSCSGSCNTLHKQTKSYGCYEELCKHQRSCKGKLYKCESMPDYRHVSVCLDNPNTGRRYAFVSWRNGTYRGLTTYGRHGESCRSQEINLYVWFSWFSDCGYCFCLCDEQGAHSDRYFSLWPVTSNISNNRVITGLRFVKKNRIIHFQIQEGKLLPGGHIDVSTVRWVPVKENNVDAYGNGRDYHTLTWDDRRLNLDHLLTDQGHVLTGIRFMKRDTYLIIGIGSTSFNFLTGLLNTASQEWKYSSVSERTKVDLKNPDIPILAKSPTKLNFKSNQYVEFTHTSIYTDLAQNTVPYLDAQPVEPLLPTPLGGAGIYHKGQNNYGGFIAPKITTYDFIQDLHLEFPKEKIQGKK